MERASRNGGPRPEAAAAAPPRFSPNLMYEAATWYYLQDATQAEVAQRLRVSRATVSRLLSEARRTGMVRIEVLPPTTSDEDDVAQQVAAALGLRAVHLGPTAADGAVGTALAPALAVALVSVGLRPGDALLVSSGRTVYEAAQGPLPALPGVLVAPMVGGQDEAQAWYQTNEITRQVAEKVGGVPVFLYAPAVPSAELRELLVADPTTRRVLELWETAKCAVVGVGAPPRSRASIPRFVPVDGGWLDDAVGDVVNHFVDADGGPTPYPGSERLLAVSEEALRAIPTCIAVAAGREKVPGVLAGARARYFTELVTDRSTALALLAASAPS